MGLLQSITRIHILWQETVTNTDTGRKKPCYTRSSPTSIVGLGGKRGITFCPYSQGRRGKRNHPRHCQESHTNSPPHCSCPQMNPHWIYTGEKRHWSATQATDPVSVHYSAVSHLILLVNLCSQEPPVTSMCLVCV